jgi:multidrug efflux pump subunit AcrA (membrane-fusion protein)
MRVRIVINVVLALVVLAAAGGIAALLVLTRTRPPQAAPPVKVPKVVAPAVLPRKHYPVEIVGYGSARAKTMVQITPQVSGEVVRKAGNYRAGEYVSAEQMLLEIDQTDYQQALDAARQTVELLEAQRARLDQEQSNLTDVKEIEDSRWKLAEKQWRKVTELYRREAATENDVDNARDEMLSRKSAYQNVVNQLNLIAPRRRELEAQLAAANVERRKAQTALDRTVVRSPLAGRVLSCAVEVGDRVQAGTSCGGIYATHVMEVPVSIPAEDLQWLARRPAAGAPGSADILPAQAKVEWHGGPPHHRPWKGRAVRTEAGLTEQTRTATLVVEVENGGGEPLDLNMFCKVTVTGKVLEEVFVLPRGAIQADGTVYVVDRVPAARPDKGNPGPTTRRAAGGGAATRAAPAGRLAQRRVVVARFTDNEALVLPGGGLEAEDRVVTSDIPKPVIGMPVEPIDSLSAAGEAGATAGAEPDDAP